MDDDKTTKIEYKNKENGHNKKHDRLYKNFLSFRRFCSSMQTGSDINRRPTCFSSLLMKGASLPPIGKEKY